MGKTTFIFLFILVHIALCSAQFYFGPSNSTGDGLTPTTPAPIESINSLNLSNAVAYVLEGTYSVLIQLSVSNQNITITPYQNKNVIFYNNNSNIFYLYQKNYVTIINIKFVKISNSNNFHLISLSGAAHITIQNCTFQGTSNQLASIYLDSNTDYATISNNVFNWTGGVGVYMDGSDNCLVEGNSFIGTYQGIYTVSGVQYNIYRRNTFQNNVYPMTFDGTGSTRMKHTLVEQNYFENCTNDLIVSSADLVFRDNIFVNVRLQFLAQDVSFASPNTTRVYDNVFIQQNMEAVYASNSNSAFPGWLDIRNNVMFSTGVASSIDINIQPFETFTSTFFLGYPWNLYGNCLQITFIQDTTLNATESSPYFPWIVNNTQINSPPNVTSIGIFPLQASVENACLSARVPLAIAQSVVSVTRVYLDDATPFFTNDQISVNGMTYTVTSVSSNFDSITITPGISVSVTNASVYRLGSIISNQTISSTSTNSTTDGNFSSSSAKYGTPMDIAVIIIVIVGAFLIAGIVAAIFLVYRRRKKNQPSKEPSPDAENAINLQSRSTISHGSVHEIAVIGSQEIRIIETLGEGRFGAVYKGLFNEVTQVALKRLKNENKGMDFSREASLLVKLRHPNIIAFHGIWTSPDKTEYMVFEFADKGSLQDFLQLEENNLDLRTLLSMALQVSSGMQYLESKGIIHRDLAARNILVKEEHGNYALKISDFGLSRETTNSIYQANDNELPVRWTAPEALVYNKHSHKSDVWSFGIVLWEIFEFGKLPYAKYTNAVTREKVMEGYRLDKPSNCPSEVYELMLSCWNAKPQERPTFTSMREFFASKIGTSEIPESKTSTVSSSIQFYVSPDDTYNNDKNQNYNA